MMRKVLCIVLVSLCFMGMAGTAQALVLNPGGFLDISASVALPTGLAGNTLVASIPPTAFAGISNLNITKYTGSFSEWVYSNSDGLLFVYQFSNDPTPTGSLTRDSISKMPVTEYAGFSILNVGAFQGDIIGGIVTPLLGHDQPYSVNRSADGGTVGFMHELGADAGVAPGAQSSLAWIQTNAQYFGPGSVTFQNGAVTSLNAIGPVVPEPASMALLSLGLLGVARLRRKIS